MGNLGAAGESFSKILVCVSHVKKAALDTQSLCGALSSILSSEFLEKRLIFNEPMQSRKGQTGRAGSEESGTYLQHKARQSSSII